MNGYRCPHGVDIEAHCLKCEEYESLNYALTPKDGWVSDEYLNALAECLASTKETE